MWHLCREKVCHFYKTVKGCKSPTHPEKEPLASLGAITDPSPSSVTWHQGLFLITPAGPTLQEPSLQLPHHNRWANSLLTSSGQFHVTSQWKASRPFLSLLVCHPPDLTSYCIQPGLLSSVTLQSSHRASFVPPEALSLWQTWTQVGCPPHAQIHA